MGDEGEVEETEFLAVAEGDETDVSERCLGGDELLEGSVGATEEACGEGGLAFVDDVGEVETANEGREGGGLDVCGCGGDGHGEL